MGLYPTAMINFQRICHELTQSLNQDQDLQMITKEIEIINIHMKSL